MVDKIKSCLFPQLYLHLNSTFYTTRLNVCSILLDIAQNVHSFR